jgi:hypothetical protein
MTRPAINPGKVDWSGENPGMYLKQTADGPFVTLISFFRVVLSPHGKGHAAFLLLDPQGAGKDPARPNVCLTDNEPLAAYLRDGFVAHFGAFKGAWDFMAAGDGSTTHTEWFRSALGQVSLTWDALGAPFIVELPKEKSATGKHEMFSLFVESPSVRATINGKPVTGRAFPREFAGKKDSSTAFLAFSETWVTVG